MAVEPPPTGWRFPPAEDADDDIVGFGADLEPGTLLEAYRHGLFPMRAELPGFLPRHRGRGQAATPMAWWSPVERGVLPLDGLRVSRSLRQSVRRFEIRVDTAFESVVAGCADPARASGWIEDDVATAYSRLHELGWAHSVEAWQDGELAGGLYGVAIGGLFAGESMFSRVRDASKVTLVALVEMLRDEHADRRLLDTQWQTPHLATLGVVEIPRREYLGRLAEALPLPLPAAFG